MTKKLVCLLAEWPVLCYGGPLRIDKFHSHGFGDGRGKIIDPKLCKYLFAMSFDARFAGIQNM